MLSKGGLVCQCIIISIIQSNKTVFLDFQGDKLLVECTYNTETRSTLTWVSMNIITVLHVA